MPNRETNKTPEYLNPQIKKLSDAPEELTAIYEAHRGNVTQDWLDGYDQLLYDAGETLENLRDGIGVPPQQTADRLVFRIEELIKLLEVDNS